MSGKGPEKGRKPTDWALMQAEFRKFRKFREFREFGANLTSRNSSLSRRAN